MPITFKENGIINISGLEYSLFSILHHNLSNDLPIADVLKRIQQVEHSDLIINMPYDYPVSLWGNESYAPVHIAARQGNVAALKLLSDAGANFNCFSYYNGKSPLHLAAQNNYPDAIEYLVRVKKLAVDTQIQKGKSTQCKSTPLFQSAQCGHIEATEKLISLGADANYKNTEGMTPLHYACEAGFAWKKPEEMVKIVLLLIEHGADPALKAKSLYKRDPSTPVECIRDDAHREIINQAIVDFYKNKKALATQKLLVETKKVSATESRENKDEISNDSYQLILKSIDMQAINRNTDEVKSMLPNASENEKSHSVLLDKVGDSLSSYKESDMHTPKEFKDFGSLGSPVRFILTKGGLQSVNKDILKSVFDSINGWCIDLSSEKLKLNLRYKGEHAVFKNNKLWIDNAVVTENDSRLLTITKQAALAAEAQCVVPGISIGRGISSGGLTTIISAGPLTKISLSR